MSILTKEERNLYLPDLIARAQGGCEGDEDDGVPRDEFCTEHFMPSLWCEPCLADWLACAIQDINALEARIDTIETIARASHDTRTVGGAHAALRDILAVIRGADTEEGDQ